MLYSPPMGKQLPMQRKKDECYYLYAGREHAGPFDDATMLVFSSDGSTAAYTVKKDEQYYLYVGKRRLGPFEDIVFRPVLSSDKKTVSYEAQRDGQWYKEIFMDGKTYIGSLLPDGRIVYVDDDRIMLKE